MDLQDLPHLLRQTYVFSRLSEAELAQLMPSFVPHRFHAGDTIVRRDEPSHGWYIVQAGKARVLDRRADATGPPVLGPRDTFGDRSLIERAAWPFSVRADTAVTIYALPAPAFEAFVRHDPERRQELFQRVAQNAEFEFVRRLRLFAHLTPDRIESLLESADRRTCSRGEYLFREDDPADSCYIVRSGRVHLLKLVGQSQKQLAVRREGDLIGEVEMLYGTPRIAGALASTEVDLLILPREVFDRYIPEGPAREAMFHLATERLLQYQHMLADSAPPADELVPDLSARWVSVPGRRAPVFPLVAAKSSTTAALACLAMIDAAHHREGDWHDRLESLLSDRRVHTLLTSSRTLEDCGYFTRLVRPASGRISPEELPALIADDDGGLAVLFRLDGHGAVIGNPVNAARGVRNVEPAEFQRWWDGQLLTVTAPLSTTKGLPARRYLRALAPIAMASLLIQLLGLGGPLASKTIVDRVLVNGDRSMLLLLLVALSAVVIFQFLATVLRDYLMAHLHHRVTLVLQRRFLDHILHLPQSVLTTRPVAELATRFRENELLVQRAAHTVLTTAVDGSAVTACFAALWLLSRPAAVIAGLFAVAYVLVVIVSAPMLRAMGRRGIDARAALQAHVLETASGIQTIKALLVEPLFFDRGRKLMARLKAAEFGAARLTDNVALIGTGLHLAAVVAIISYLTRLVSAGQATTGDMVASLGVFGATLAPLSGLLDARANARAVQASRASLEEVQDLESESSVATAAPPSLEGHVSLSHVSFRYPGQTDDVLSDVTLEVLPGQTVAIVGRSGSGKTTLVNLLIGLYPPTSGNIYIDHLDIQSIPSTALRRQFGVVEQHPFLFDGTIRANIAKADPSASLERIIAAATVAGASGFIDALPSGYDTRVGERGASLSGGEKQRLMIARALIASPRLLILDEATSAVDSRSESAIQQNIRQAAAGRTTFVIAHRLSTIRHADVIVVLDRGRVVEMGTHAELMAARSLYYYLSTRTV